MCAGARPDSLTRQMALLVEEQDHQVVAVEAKAADAEQNMGQAEGQLQKAVKSARAARRKRWICFIIIVIIRASRDTAAEAHAAVAIVGIVVGVTVSNNMKKN